MKYYFGMRKVKTFPFFCKRKSKRKRSLSPIFIRFFVLIYGFNFLLGYLLYLE
jgi:hypothetical protein